MEKEPLPLIQGAGRILEIVPIVIKTIAGSRTTDKTLLRNDLMVKFKNAFIMTKGGKAYSTGGKPLRSEHEIKKNLEWTWLDQYALPMCERLRIIRRNGGYRLTSYGEQLAEAIRKGHLKEKLAQFAIKQDKEQWHILEILGESGPSNLRTLLKIISEKVTVRKPFHLTSLLRLFKVLGLVESEKGKYQLVTDQYQSLMKEVAFRTYDEVSDQEFIDALAKEYRKIVKRRKSPYSPIEELRGAVCKALDYWPEEFFDRRIKEIPLSIFNVQLLFSQAAFPRKNGILRKGRYYNYLSIYRRRE